MQEGIYYDKGETPGKNWAVIILRVNDNESEFSVKEELKIIWEILNKLKKGQISDLPSHNLPVPKNGLQVTIGYGKNIFGKSFTNKNVPEELLNNNFRSPKVNGGGKILLASGLRYSDNLIKNPGTEDILIQFISDSELLTYRCYLEIYKYIHQKSKNEEYPIEIVKFYNGFQREDHRSWLDFHDGINNLESGKERLDAIGIKKNNTSEDNWIVGGTFLCFMRIEVNLDLWYSLSDKNQELFVGRKKVSGCPVVSIENDLPVAQNNCPFVNTQTIVDRDSNGQFINKKFFETPQVSNSIIQQSHVQRANHHRFPVSQRDSLRIFRQGYEFIETSKSDSKVSFGLNFISFQDTPERIIRMISQKQWLGNVNFGGSDKEQGSDNEFLKIHSAGLYAIPPNNESDQFPGIDIFKDSVLTDIA